MDYQPVIIIGAPRSGTNMLRDMLTELSGVGTWPCDEINYIWRHRNLRHPSDEFTSGMAAPEIQRYIRNQFNQLAKSKCLDTVIEKTCANSLRVGFVDKILPEAKYIFIVRDGVDAVGSALARWTAKLDVPYILKKVRYVPPTDLPYYAFRYLNHRMYRFFSKDRRVALWGPTMDNIDDLLKRYSLIEVCALQWRACVDQAERDFALISSKNVLMVKYEDFVISPVAEFAKLSEFIGKDVPDVTNDYLRAIVSPNSIGKGRMALSKNAIEKIRPLIANTLKQYDYK
jgi:hypothetical protein